MLNLLNFCAHGLILGPILLMVLFNTLKLSFARRNFVRIAILSAVFQLLCTGLSLYAMRAQGLSTYAFPVFWRPDMPGASYFELTRDRTLFLLVVGMVALVSALIASRTVDANRSSYANLLMLVTLGMNGTLLASDLFSLFVFMEVTGICCFVMIAMFRSRVDLEGAFKYLAMSELASIFILSGLAFLFMKTGSLRFDDLTNFMAAGTSPLTDMLAYAACVLILAGFAIKTGAVPFHSWLPDAHQSADTAVSVLLSGVVIKVAGIYGLLVIARLAGNLLPVRISLAFLGILSVVLGALLAFRQRHFKRVVAYSSVSQMGYIMLGLAAGSPLGIVAALAHVFSHGAFKSTLFVNAAALHEQADSLDMDELGGLENRMPITAFSSVIAFLSTAGIPPMAGFWSKLLILLALWQAGWHALAAAALLASIFTGTYLLRMQRKVFFGTLKPGLEHVREATGGIRTAEILLTAVTLGVGLCYPWILMLLHQSGLI